MRLSLPQCRDKGTGRRCSDSCQETWELSEAASGLAHPTQELGHWVLSPHPCLALFLGKMGALRGRGAGASWRVAIQRQGLKVTQECALAFSGTLSKSPPFWLPPFAVSRCPVPVDRCPARQSRTGAGHREDAWQWLQEPGATMGRPSWGARLDDRTEHLG